MRVLITGASGFIGSRLCSALRKADHQVLTVSRGAQGDFDWTDENLERGLGAVEAVIHLAGENLFGRRWSPKQKDILRSSRVDITRRLARMAGDKGVEVMISASAVGYYGPHADQTLDESSAAGSDFLAQLCRDWESASAPAREAGVRVATVRIGVVLGLGGGALAKMLPPFRFGLGGPLGSGRQIVSWIHLDDLVKLFLALLEHDDLEGVFNATAPRAVSMKELSSALGRALHRPAFFPLPSPILRLALGEAADVLLTGQRVVPQRLLDAGFEFDYPQIDGALANLLSR